MHNLSLFIISTCICLASPICKAAEHGPAHTVFAEASARKDKKKGKNSCRRKEHNRTIKTIARRMDYPVGHGQACRYADKSSFYILQCS